MRLGVVFPQTEIGADPVAIRDYAQAAESLGYHHLLVYDHVLGANAASRHGWSGAYRHTDMFHEVFVLFGYLAAVTRTIELANGILVLPQRQTALVAKQAASIDVMSGGRLRLGIGIGWNAVEYEALNEDFHDRGLRSEEQVEVLRALWTRELVTFDGRWHKITDAGLNPLPVQRPIPIWFGGTAEPVLRRIGRLGDGWIMGGSPARPDGNLRAMVSTVHEQARKAGREPSAIGMEKVLSYGDPARQQWARALAEWQDVGVTHVSINTMGSGLSSPGDHIDAIRRYKEAVGAS